MGKVNVALTDKDMVECKVLKSEMPQIRTLIDKVVEAPDIEPSGTDDLLGIARLDCETRTEMDNDSGKYSFEGTSFKQAEYTVQ